MDLWTALLDVLILLLAAMLLGGLCERLKQSAILGYLLAGTLVGPNALDLMPNHEAVTTIAELGVALLLFTIALEFSWSRLRRIGPIALGGGTLQVLLTGTIAASVCMMVGLGGAASVAIGTMIALSSTACVLRLLVSRAEIDTVYGRNALGILLLQDIAVVPLVLLVTVLGSGGSVVQIGWEIGRTVAFAALLVAESKGGTVSTTSENRSYGVPRRQPDGYHLFSIQRTDVACLNARSRIRTDAGANRGGMQTDSSRVVGMATPGAGRVFE